MLSEKEAREIQAQKYKDRLQQLDTVVSNRITREKEEREKEAKDKDERRKEKEKQRGNKERMCERCHKVFSFASNKNDACVIHTGKLKGKMSKHWSCCKQPKHSDGCVVAGAHLCNAD